MRGIVVYCMKIFEWMGYKGVPSNPHDFITLFTIMVNFQKHPLALLEAMNFAWTFY